MASTPQPTKTLYLRASHSWFGEKPLPRGIMYVLLALQACGGNATLRELSRWTKLGPTALRRHLKDAIARNLVEDRPETHRARLTKAGAPASNRERRFYLVGDGYVYERYVRVPRAWLALNPADLRDLLQVMRSEDWAPMWREEHLLHFDSVRIAEGLAGLHAGRLTQVLQNAVKLGVLERLNAVTYRLPAACEQLTFGSLNAQNVSSIEEARERRRSRFERQGASVLTTKNPAHKEENFSGNHTGNNKANEPVLPPEPVTSEPTETNIPEPTRAACERIGLRLGTHVLQHVRSNEDAERLGLLAYAAGELSKSAGWVVSALREGWDVNIPDAVRAAWRQILHPTVTVTVRAWFGECERCGCSFVGAEGDSAVCSCGGNIVVRGDAGTMTREAVG